MKITIFFIITFFTNHLFAAKCKVELMGPAQGGFGEQRELDKRASMELAATALRELNYDVRILNEKADHAPGTSLIEFSYPVTGFVYNNYPKGALLGIVRFFSPLAISGVYISHNLNGEKETVWNHIFEGEGERLSGNYDEQYNKLVLELIDKEVPNC